MAKALNGPAASPAARGREKTGAPARPKLGPARDPFAGVLRLGPRIPVAVMIAAAILAVSLHATAAVGAVQAAVLHAFGAWARDIRAAVALNLGQTYDIEVTREKPPEPPPKEEPKEEPKPEPKPMVKDPAKEDPPPQPPAASDAAKVLTQEPAKDDPVDLTGNTFLSGNADTANGGVTQIGGTAKQATYNAAAVATGVPGGTGTAPAPAAPAIDRSRAARIKNLANLERCPFPGEADAEQIDEAAVSIEVKVSVDGRADSVAITSDPGHGFGREAKKCALREKYDPALDVTGNPIPGVFRVRFRFSR